MAIKITAYTCKHKCGRTVLTSKKRMEEHESMCFRDPKNRACVTCDNFTDRIGCHEGVDISNKLKSGCVHYFPDDRLTKPQS